MSCHKKILDDDNILVCDVNCNTCKILKKYNNLPDYDLCRYPLIACNKKTNKTQKFYAIYPENINGKVALSASNINLIFMRSIVTCYVTDLDISDNNITYLPDILTLKKLNCAKCKIKTLPRFLPNIREIDANDNLLTHIYTYQTLETLICSNNIIKELPHLPNLKYLQCNNNPITEINIPSLTSLEAYGCPIMVIHNIPSLIKKSSILLANGLVRYIQYNKSKLSNNYVLINWLNNYISESIYLNISNNNLIYNVVPFLFSNI